MKSPVVTWEKPRRGKQQVRSLVWSDQHLSNTLHTTQSGCCVCLSGQSMVNGQTIHSLARRYTASKNGWTNVRLTLDQRRRRWANISPTLGQRLVFGIPPCPLCWHTCLTPKYTHNLIIKCWHCVMSVENVTIIWSVTGVRQCRSW